MSEEPKSANPRYWMWALALFVVGFAGLYIGAATHTC